MIYFRFAGYRLILLFSLGCFFRFRNDPRRWFFLSLAAAMTLMEISAASSRLPFRNEIAARSSKLRQMVADGKERLANSDPKKIEDDPKLRAIEIMIPRVETELDDLAIAPPILPSVPWNTVELYAAIASIGFQLITLVQVVQWNWIRQEPKSLQGRP